MLCLDCIRDEMDKRAEEAATPTPEAVTTLAGDALCRKHARRRMADPGYFPGRRD